VYTVPVPIRASLVLLIPTAHKSATLLLELFSDLDELVGTDQAFLLGSWIDMARAKFTAGGVEDCAVPSTPKVNNCRDFVRQSHKDPYSCCEFLMQPLLFTLQ